MLQEGTGLDKGISRRQALRAGLVGAAGMTAGLALSACGPLAKPTATKPKVLLVWQPWRVQWGSGWNQVFYDYTAPFRKEHPGLDIAVSAPTSGSDDQLVQTEILGGSGPDVFSGYDPAALIEGGLTLNLEPYIREQKVDLSLFDAGQLGHFVMQGGVWGLPAELSTTAVLVNLGLIDQLGYPHPAPNWTTSEAAKLWNQLTTTQRHGHSVWWSIAPGLPGEYLWRSYGASIARHNFSMHSALDTTAALEFANWFYPQLNSGAIQNGIPSTQQIVGEAVATTTLGSWQLPWAALNLQGMTWDFYPTPAGPSGSTSYAGRDYYAVSVNTKHPKESAAFLLWLTTSPDWLTNLIRLQLVIPPISTYWSTWVERVKAVAPPLAQKNLGAFVAPALQGKAYAHPAFPYLNDAAYSLIGQYTAKIVSQTMSPAAALPQAVSRVYQFEVNAKTEVATQSGVAKLLNQAKASKSPIQFPAPSAAGIGVPYSTPPSGAITHTGGTWTLVGDGSDVWSTSDNCVFACLPETASQAQFTCRVTSLQNVDCPHLSQWAKVGLMARMDLSDDSIMVALIASGGNGVFIDTRAYPGSGASQQNETSPTAKTGLIGSQVLTSPENPKTPHQNRLLHPVWLRLRRLDGTWTCFTSTDGTTWTQAGTPVSLPMAGCFVGIFCTAHNTSFGGTGRIRATVDHLDFTPTQLVQLGTPGGA